MTWKVEEMLQSGDRIIVEGRAFGTPTGPLFGSDRKGKALTIMSIDIRKLKDGKISTTYHVEDRAGALKQLEAEYIQDAAYYRAQVLSWFGTACFAQVRERSGT